MRRSILATAMLAATLSLAPTPARAAEASHCAVVGIATLAVTMNGLQPLISARINGVDVQFLADSGAFFSMIGPRGMRDAKLRMDFSGLGVAVGGVGGKTMTLRTTIKDMSLSGYTIRKADFLVGPVELGAAIGMIGQNVLGIADAEYDLANSRIRLVEPRGCEQQSLAYWANGLDVASIAIESVRQPNQRIAGIIFVNGVKMRAVFDTGATTTVMTLAAAAKAGMKPGSPGVVAGNIGGGVGARRMQQWIGRFASFRIDSEEIKAPLLRFADIEAVDFDMLIGADFFLAHRIYVSNMQHRLYLTYNGGRVFDLTAKTEGTLGQSAGDSAPPQPAKSQ